MILDRVVSKNISECIKQDLYWYGKSYIKEVYNQMTYFKSKSSSYKLKFSRVDSLVPRANYKYICKLTIINNLGLEELTLRFTEIDAFAILDNLATFSEFNQDSLIVPISSSNDNLSTYQVVLSRRDNIISLSILQYNQFSETMIPRVILELDEDEYSSLMYSMYFSYLIDIDTGDIAEQEYLYQTLLKT